MSIYTFGSLAFDRIMTFPGRFADHILPEKLHILNVCFLISNMEEKPGGTAGNIAYSLALLGERPIIVSTVGKDFAPYEDKLRKLSLPLDGLRYSAEHFTAAAYITTDMMSNQITGFHPAAMNVPIDYNFDRIDSLTDFAIIGPGNFDDMRRLPEVFKAKGLRYIFDPGQQIPLFSGDELVKAISGSYMLITNDYELELVCTQSGKTKAEIQALTKVLITTFGEKGSLVCEQDREYNIGIATPAKILDPTGCGDAYRSGLLKGLSSGCDIKHAAKLGAVCASYCIEYDGPQEHVFDIEDFRARYIATFNEQLPF